MIYKPGTEAKTRQVRKSNARTKSLIQKALGPDLEIHYDAYCIATVSSRNEVYKTIVDSLEIRKLLLFLRHKA